MKLLSTASIAFNTSAIESNSKLYLERNFSSKIPMVPKNILFKVPTITEEIDDVDLDQKEDDILPYEQFFLNQNKQDDTVLENDLFDQVAFHPKSNQDHESIVFGFPLNFN